jgi:hypothetical protein
MAPVNPITSKYKFSRKCSSEKIPPRPLVFRRPYLGERAIAQFMQCSVPAVSETVAEMDGKVHARFIVIEILGPTSQFIVMFSPTLRAIEPHRANKR